MVAEEEEGEGGDGRREQRKALLAGTALAEGPVKQTLSSWSHVQDRKYLLLQRAEVTICPMQLLSGIFISASAIFLQFM